MKCKHRSPIATRSAFGVTTLGASRSPQLMTPGMSTPIGYWCPDCGAIRRDDGKRPTWIQPKEATR